jgi:hypothetical protein
VIEGIVEQSIIVAGTIDMNSRTGLLIEYSITREGIITAIIIQVDTIAYVVGNGITEEGIIFRGNIEENSDIGIVRNGIPKEGIIASRMYEDSIVTVIDN